VRQLAIATDQWFNAALGGMADETISARLYRNKMRSWWWSFWYHAVNAIFFNRNHCFNSWLAEVNRKQLPKDYRQQG
jgi:hypothetical protein